MTVKKDIQTALTTIIRGLTLAGLDNATEIKQRKKPWDNTGVIHRGISICPTKEDVRPNWPAQVDDVKYGFQVYMIVANTDRGEPELDEEYVYDWRKKIRTALLHRRLPEMPTCVYSILVTHEDVFLPDRYRENNDASALYVHVWAREYERAQTT